MGKVALPALMDAKQLAQAAAMIKAWWNGADAPPAPPSQSAEEADLFEPAPKPLDPRLAALALVWGEGRLAPEDAAGEALIPARLDTDANATFFILAPGLCGPVAEVARGHQGPIKLFEWRAETREALTDGLRAGAIAARVETAAFDLDTGVLPAEAAGGLWANEAFTYCSNPVRLALQIARALGAGARALIDDYALVRPEPLGAAFASAFQEPQLIAASALEAALQEAGLKIETREDLVEETLAQARGAFARLPERLEAGGMPGARLLQELAWELESWADRRRLLAAGVLTRQRLTVVKR